MSSTSSASYTEVFYRDVPDSSPAVGLLLASLGVDYHQDAHANNDAQKLLQALGVRVDLTPELLEQLPPSDFGLHAQPTVVDCLLVVQSSEYRAAGDPSGGNSHFKGAVIDAQTARIWIINEGSGAAEEVLQGGGAGCSSTEALQMLQLADQVSKVASHAPSSTEELAAALMSGFGSEDPLKHPLASAVIHQAALVLWLKGFASCIEQAVSLAAAGVSGALQLLDLLVQQTRELAVANRLESDTVLQHIRKQRLADVAASKSKTSLSMLQLAIEQAAPAIDLYDQLNATAGLAGIGASPSKRNTPQACVTQEGAGYPLAEGDVDWSRHEVHRLASAQCSRHTAANAASQEKYSRMAEKPGGVAVIAEIKRASPSKGDIFPGADVATFAKAYTKGGAAAISVLTEPTWFKGNLDDLKVARRVAEQESMPGCRPAILRKDFVVDEYMVYEARAAEADSVLLIVAILDQDELIHLMDTSRSLGMEPLVEVATDEEMARALTAGARVIGINNRNLHDFKVDMHRTEKLLSAISSNPTVLMMALSGITCRADVQRFAAAGVRAVLVGEWLMRRRDPASGVGVLRGTGYDAGPLVKICGLRDGETAVQTVRAGADMIGLVFAKSPRLVAADQAAEIARTVRQCGAGGHHRLKQISQELGGCQFVGPTHLEQAMRCGPLLVGVFADQSVEEVNRLAIASDIDVIQLSGSHDVMEDCNKPLYHLPVMAAVHVGNDARAVTLMSSIRKLAPQTALLDTKTAGMHGGSGVTFDWQVACEAAALCDVKGPKGFFLAGGLKPENVWAAVQQVRPFGLDVSSGVETDGVKDLDKIAKFVREAKQG